MIDVNLKLKEIKGIFDTLVKNNKIISNEKTRLDNETKNERSRLTLLNVNEIAKLRTNYAGKSLLYTMINNTNIQINRVIKGFDTSNRTAKKKFEIDYRDKHYITLANYINNNTRDKVRIVKDRIPDHVKNLESLLHKENVKLQSEVGLLIDNMITDINNLDKHRRIYDLRIELKNEINKENEISNAFIQNNKAHGAINDLEQLYQISKIIWNPPMQWRYKTYVIFYQRKIKIHHMRYLKKIS